MDMTWNMMSQYVKAMLMAVFYKVGIPIALAFEPRETKELYSRFYTSFSEMFHVDLSNYVL
jgi:hypothetical protein